MKVYVNHGNGLGADSLVVDLRLLEGPGHQHSQMVLTPGALVFDGYHYQSSTEKKARLEVGFHEALDLIERLKEAVAKTPCPTCHRLP